MNYKTFINLPRDVINRDKEFFDHLEYILNDQSKIMCDEDISTKAKEQARLKWNMISAIKFTFIGLTNYNLNQEPTNENS